MTRKFTIIAVTTAMAAFAAAPAAADGHLAEERAAAADAGTEIRLNEIPCWEVLQLEDNDRANALVLVYGYLAGTRNGAATTTEEIERVVVNSMMECLDKPDETLMSVMRTHLF